MSSRGASNIKTATGIKAESLIACVVAAGEVQARRVEREGSVIMGREFDCASYFGSAMEHYGLTSAEVADYDNIRAKGYTSAEAAEIIIRSRRPSKAGGG